MPEPFRRARRKGSGHAQARGVFPPAEETGRKREVLAAARHLLRDDRGATSTWLEELDAALEEGGVVRRPEGEAPR